MMADPIDPIAKYQRTGKDICTVQTMVSSTGTTGTNIQIIAGITGKRIRIMGWDIQSSSGTAGAAGFIDGSGGASLYPVKLFPPNTNGESDKLPIVDSGYFETSTSTGLYANIGGGAVNMAIFYITYAP